MEAQQLKATLHQQIEQADSSASSERKVMTMEELKDEIKESQKEFERGEFYTVEALEKDMEAW